MRKLLGLLLVFLNLEGGVIMNLAWAENPYGELSGYEKNVILNKGTERPGSGKYNSVFDLGVYACRNCGAPLYVSDDKFKSSCGWPAFDDEIPGAVKHVIDADGQRTEILCAKCNGHLGHVFEGEHLTEQNIRHCVNSTSLVFEPQLGGRLARAVFAGGCFWGVEELMRHQNGVLAVVSGYTGGVGARPDYDQVCSGKGNFAEAVEVIYDTRKTNFETLCKYFLEIHDPTQLNRQGPDIGSQYRSAIFYLDDNQKNIAEKLLQQLRDKNYQIKTQVIPFQRFFNAEVYHQDYYERKGTLPYCHRYEKRF